MDPISSIASINRLISARKLKEKEPKPRSGKAATTPSQQAKGAEKLSQTIAHAIQQLPSKQQTGTEENIPINLGGKPKHITGKRAVLRHLPRCHRNDNSPDQARAL